MNRCTDGAPRHRCGVGDQIQCRRMEWFETKPDHECACDRYRRPESRRSLDECAKTKGDKQNLQAAIGGDSSDRLFHDFELPGLDRDVVEVDRSQNDPGDFQYSERNTVAKAKGGESGRHFEEEDCDRYGRRGTGDGAPVRFDLQTGQQPEKNNDRQGRNQRGEPPMTERVVDLGPLHHNLLANGVCYATEINTLWHARGATLHDSQLFGTFT